MKKQIFKVGDKVYDIRYGWGEVINDNWSDVCPIRVKYENGFSDTYTHYGSWHQKFKNPLLSFTEYTIQGFSQERPKPQPKVGKMCVFWDGDEDDNRGRRVIAILERIYDGVYYENDTPWVNCITLEEFYKQQNK